MIEENVKKPKEGKMPQPARMDTGTGSQTGFTPNPNLPQEVNNLIQRYTEIKEALKGINPFWGVE